MDIKATTRWCVVEQDEKPSAARLRDEILRGENITSDFSTILVPAPPRDQTVFKVCGNDRVLVVAVALFDAVNQRIATQKSPMNDSAEIYFDLRHDHLGWFRFEFTPEGEAKTSSFLPYPEAHSSAYPLLRLQKHETQTEYFPSGSSNAWRCRWVFAWFDVEQVFRESAVCGFNICRWRPGSHEFSAWNYPSGNGGPDATGFGHLHREPPAIELKDVAVRREKSALILTGGTTKLKKLQWELSTPLGERKEIPAEIQNNQWQAAIPLKSWPSGRYRLTARSGNNTIEPHEYFFDVAPAQNKADFTVSMTYDFPDCLMANYYTPQRLSAEMKTIAGWGINRLHWIDYSDAPSFWRAPYWNRTHPVTVGYCGDLLTCAVEQAHANNLEIIADFKVFDLGINTFHLKDKRSTVQELEGCRSVAIPEIAAHREWTLQSNADWRREASLPITKLRFYSKTRLPKFEPSAVRLQISEDNQRYKNYTGPLQIRQGTAQRPHARWSPAGKTNEAKTERNWFLELSGLDLNCAFAALQIDGQDAFARQHGFLLMEAKDSQGALAPLTLATTGHRDFKEEGYFFSKEWPGWNNYTEPMVLEREWRLNDLGFTFQESPDMPTLLEPTYEGARDIWLKRIEKMLDAGVDGVCIRILNHHNGVMSWLQFAFAPAVVTAFYERYGRAPETTPEDYERVRRLRGEYFTQFLRDAKKLTSAQGKKLMVQLESGIEVPPHLDTRMQIFLDYKTWLEEKIVDEALMKDWTAQSPWVHENILPLARRQKIPIHIISRCLNNGLDDWAMETTPQMLTDAYRAGFSGYNFYEVQNLMELNPAGTPQPKGYTAPAISKACRDLRRLQNN